jgi:acetyltransferase-like isoleucine patch superfamily enzyme
MPASLEDFTAAVTRLGELRAQGLLQTKVSPAGGVAFVIDKAAEDVPAQGNGVYQDIYETLGAIASRVPVEQFVALGDEADRAVLQAKYEVVAAAFPPDELKPGRWDSARARQRRWLAGTLIALARSSGRLHRLMGRSGFRKVLGPEGRRAAWCALGAKIDETAWIGLGVTMLVPRHVSIGAGSMLTGRIMIESRGEVSIGRNVLMNDDLDLFSSQHDVDDPGFKGQRRSISIGDYAWLPHKIVVLPGVSIGSHAVIGTGSVVSRDVPDYGVAVGNPARVVKERARIRYTYTPTSVDRPRLIR